MKLLYCKKCHDSFSLARHVKKCSCGAVEGRYTDGQNAEYSGDAIPFAVDNYSFVARAKQSPDSPANDLYDAWYGEGKIQAWILNEGSPNFETIRQVKKQTEPKKKLARCGAK